MNRTIQRDNSLPLPGAAYIRFSSEMQSDSFSLDAQLRQIKEQAERDGVEIVKVFSDPAFFPSELSNSEPSNQP